MQVAKGQKPFSAIKILIVDDQHYMRKVLITMLAGLGVSRVYEAQNGQEGLQEVRRLNPDLVLVDWDMPVMDGLEFIRRIRTPGEFAIPDVPIIMLTGHGDRWRVIEAARFGVHEFLLKPISTNNLLDRIKAVLDRPRPMMELDHRYIPAPRKLFVLDID